MRTELSQRVSYRDDTVRASGVAEAAFRIDIQALRGIAVLLVVLYHASLPGLTAGYLGVDIFFVISGFLITGIIRRGLEADSFSFAQFYYRRAKRLLPAAYVVLALTVLAAPFFLTAQALVDLKQQIIGALTFSINFVFWQQAGYFDAAAEMKPLLHFWSLAIEEQYYLLMPALLFIVPRRTWLPAVFALLAASLALSIYWAATAPDAAFYLLPSRWWELALGSAGALLPARYLGSSLLSWSRIPAIAALVIVPFFPTGLPHPGADAFILCVATLVIILGHNNSRWEAIAPARLLARVGDFSYSLYLVHWPVIVFTRAAWLEEAPAHALATAVVLSFVLSWFLFRYVEEPFRRGFTKMPRRVVTGLASASLMLALSPTIVASATDSGMDFKRLRRTNFGIDRSCASGGKRPAFSTVSDGCRTRSHPKVLIVGDSYAMAWSTALMATLSEVGLAQATMSACDPLLGMARYPKQTGAEQEGAKYNYKTGMECLLFNETVLEYARSDKDIEIVVLAGRLQGILQTNYWMLVRDQGGLSKQEITENLVATGIGRMIDALRKSGKKVVILAPPPANGMEIGECLERTTAGLVTFDAPKNCLLPREAVKVYRAPTVSLLNSVAATSEVSVLDVYDFLCNETECKTMIDGVPLYRDSGHLSVEGAVLIGKKTELASRILSEAR